MTTLRTRTTDEGLELAVRVVPRAKRDAVVGVHDGALKVQLRAPPAEGKANAALVALLSSVLDVPRRAVSIVRGDKSRTKTVHIEGLDADALPW